MKRLFVLAAMLTMSKLSFAGNLAIGAGWLYSDNAYLNTKSDSLVIPFLSYQHKYFSLFGPFAKLRYPIDEKNIIGVLFQFGFQEFKPRDSSNAQMKLLNKRKRIYYAGSFYRHKTDFGDFMLHCVADITGRTKGGLYGAFTYNLTFADKARNYFLRPSLGLKWDHAKINQHFYRVSAAESLVSGFPIYSPGHTISPFVNLFASLKLADRLHWVNVANVSYIPSKINKSPMTSNQRFSYNLITGLTIEMGSLEQRYNH